MNLFLSLYVISCLERLTPYLNTGSGPPGIISSVRSMKPLIIGLIKEIIKKLILCCKHVFQDSYDPIQKAIWP